MATSSLFEPLDTFLVRAPVLPIEAYLQFAAPGSAGAIAQQDVARLDPRIDLAVAAGSRTLGTVVDHAHGDLADRKIRAALTRYLIRMSTRPTPYGLCAGVALGRWQSQSDLTFGPALRTRTRPDMAVLNRFVAEIEADSAIRTQLRLVAHPAAIVRAGRVFLNEQAPATASAVSVRATGVVLRALATAREPTPWKALVEHLLETTAGACVEQVEQLVDELWRQTFLLTELRPPLTCDDPASYVVERLAALDGLSARSAAADLSSFRQACADWDADPHHTSKGFLALGSGNWLERAGAEPVVEVDLRRQLVGRGLSRVIAHEVAQAGEVLLRQSVHDHCLLLHGGYVQRFEEKYGALRDVPVLELIDPDVGLGVPDLAAGAGSGSTDTAQMAQREQHSWILPAVRCVSAAYLSSSATRLSSVSPPGHQPPRMCRDA